MILVLESGLQLVIDDTFFEYRSHINGFTVTRSNNFVHCIARGFNEKTYHIWYYLSENFIKSGFEFDEIDYSKPSFIEDEYGRIIYIKNEEEFL